MDMKELQFRLLDTLLRGASQNAQNPEAFKLFLGVFLKDMVHTTGRRTGKDWEPRIYFTYALCRDDEVLAVALPRLISDEGGMSPLFSRQLSALQTAGIPLFSNFFTKQEENGEPMLHLNSQDCPGPSDWRLPAVRVPFELTGLLYRKGMVSGGRSPGSPESVPTGYGNQLGLCEARWYGRDNAGHLHPGAGLHCSSAGWVNRVRLGEHPWGGGPDCVPLPLEARLERMQAGRAGSSGHCMSAFLHLEAMPVAPLLSDRLSEEYIEENLSELQERYAPGVTYGQAARNVDRLLHSKSEEEWMEGRSGLNELSVIFSVENMLRASPGARLNTGNRPSIHGTKPDGRSLSARLARAGIPENGRPGLPLVGDCLDDVFQGLSRLIGTDAPAQEFHLKTPFWLWEKIGSEWDGSLDGLIFKLHELYWDTSDEDFLPEVVLALWRLLVNPFCLMEEIRSLEEKHSVFLEEIRKQNEMIKKELERMNFDGSAS